MWGARDGPSAFMVSVTNNFTSQRNYKKAEPPGMLFVFIEF